MCIGLGLCGLCQVMLLPSKSSQGQVLKGRPTQASSGGDADTWGMPKGGVVHAPGPATHDTQNLRFRLIPTCRSPRYGEPQGKSGKADLLASQGLRHRPPLAPPLSTPFPPRAPVSSCQLWTCNLNRAQAVENPSHAQETANARNGWDERRERGWCAEEPPAAMGFRDREATEKMYKEKRLGQKEGSGWGD